jgi:hypothetical protein
MRVTNGIPLGWTLPLTGWYCEFCSNTQGMELIRMKKQLRKVHLRREHYSS